MNINSKYFLQEELKWKSKFYTKNYYWAGLILDQKKKKH